LHRDLKAENILFRSKNNNSEAVITDFGLADFYNPEGKYIFARCGTPGFVAPEILDNKVYDYKVDIFSIGVLLFYL
jgi:calcium/calmodulin-dependent protein kinase I